jgi:tryptophan synthase alpha subunit
LQDPLADGAVIHTAATRALQHGTTLDKVIDMVAKVAPELKAPLVMFTYYNPIIRRGMDKFCVQIKAAGAAGVNTGFVDVWVTGCSLLQCGTVLPVLHASLCSVGL